MPTSERETRPQPPSPSTVSMKDLLASCVAAAAVSTPPARQDGQEQGQSTEPRRPEQRRQGQPAEQQRPVERQPVVRPPAQREAA
ncbi:hypothetical protein ACPXCE_06895 [Streptomyces sp. DT24]|uniref:hypothetical protein n=1 Tax=unclassified Streptomyces TaxID=2593676 RepID=UPI0023B9DAD9|nr:hypothetical protein [Streptomyces sp. AM 4-1-1]WEH37752.1 hypothetical protein PZB75_19920 [Streptomyces sp. AM 4-1-1]